MTTTDRDARRRELSKLTKARLIRMCAAGVRTPDGGIRYIEGGMYPLSAWRKDEIVDSIVRAECGPLPSEAPDAAPGRNWQQMSAADFDAAKPLTLFAIEGGATTPRKADRTGTPDLFAAADDNADGRS
jgi:hypothetical protein